MTREVERWWVLCKLQEATDRNVGQYSHDELAAGKKEHHWRDDFIKWLSDSSKDHSWIWRPIKLWKFKMGIESAEIIRSKRIKYYDSIIDSCIRNNFVSIVVRESDKKSFLHTTSLGDDFISFFWWKKTIGHPIATAVIITVLGGVLVYYTTERIKTLTSPANKIQQIQIIPFEPQIDGTVIKPR